MGNADYAVRVFGVSIESVRKASAALRDEIEAEVKPREVHVSTSSIIGSSILDGLSPEDSTRIATALNQSIERARNDPNATTVWPAQGAAAAFVVLASLLDSTLVMSRMLGDLAKLCPGVAEQDMLVQSLLKSIITDESLRNIVEHTVRLSVVDKTKSPQKQPVP